MPTTFSTALPGPTNVFQPSFNGKQSANLIVSYARDPKKFAVNGLTQRTPVNTLSGLYMQLRPESLSKIFTNPNAILWVDGQPFPSGNMNPQDFRAVQYTCLRKGFEEYLGWQTREQAVWPIQETKLQALGHIMMTYRAKTFYDLVLTPGNHLTGHVDTATNWSAPSGGFWSAGTATNPIVKRGLLNMANRIRRDTLNTVSYKDLTLVISPNVAIAISGSQEIHNYLAQSPFALAQIRGNESQNGEWGLPDQLYNMNLIVDGTLQTTSARMVVPGTYQNIMDDNSAVVLAAPGALKSNIGQVNSAFSSVHMFVYRGEEMVVRTEDEKWNMRTKLGIHETYDMRIVAPETCALATNVLS
jgi:hypothetical protein